MSNRIAKWGAVGEEGCEFMATTKKEVQAWIDDEVAGTGVAGYPVAPDYYYIYGYTSEELKDMRET